MISTKLQTTAAVVETATPSEPPLVRKPNVQAITETMTREDEALDEPDDDVLEVDPLRQVVEVLVDADLHRRIDRDDDGAAGDADDVGVEHQHRQRQGHGDEARHGQEERSDRCPSSSAR